MMKANKSIQCTVSSCKHHCNNENYCSLDCIMVGTHECNPTMDQCTDCKSFDLKQYFQEYPKAQTPDLRKHLRIGGLFA